VREYNIKTPEGTEFHSEWSDGTHSIHFYANGTTRFANEAEFKAAAEKAARDEREKEACPADRRQRGAPDFNQDFIHAPDSARMEAWMRTRIGPRNPTNFWAFSQQAGAEIC
jgi:hypothetical protein